MVIPLNDIFCIPCPKKTKLGTALTRAISETHTKVSQTDRMRGTDTQTDREIII